MVSLQRVIQYTSAKDASGMDEIMVQSVSSEVVAGRCCPSVTPSLFDVHESTSYLKEVCFVLTLIPRLDGHMGVQIMMTEAMEYRVVRLILKGHC